jgi:cytochrome oxidase Cu insertion factor (SCO1/SenC/PrrC family)
MNYKLLLLAVVPLCAVGCPTPSAPPTGKVTADVEIPVPAFALTERRGTTVTRDDLHGRVWVASFVFTRCTGPCPQVTATMQRLQADLRLAAEPNLRLVTFTVDPDRDTPDELRDYAKRYEAHPERWLFLTGKEDDLHHLLKDGFKVSAQRSQSPTPGDEFDHSSRLVVVDKQGNIRGYYDGIQSKTSPSSAADFNANLEALRQRVTALLQE